MSCYDTKEQFEANKLSPERIVQLGNGLTGEKATLMQGKQKLAPPAETAAFIVSNLPKMEEEVYHSSYSLCAPSTDERAKWTEAIEAAISGAGTSAPQLPRKASQTSGADSVAKSATPDESSFESRTLQRNASLADFMKIRKDAENNLSDDFARERASARQKDVAQAPPWLKHSFGQFLSREMKDRVSPNRLFSILEMAQQLPWHNAVQSHKLKELRKVRRSQRLSIFEGGKSPKDENAQTQTSAHDAATDDFIAEMGRKLQSGEFTQQEHDRMVQDYRTAMTKSTIQRKAHQAMQAGEITAEQYEQILRVQAFRNPDDSDASELQEPHTDTQKQVPLKQRADSLPEYLKAAFDKTATAERPPLPPRSVLPSPTTISLKPNDVVSSADNGRGRLKREVNKITRTWDVQWDDGVTRDPYPESKLSKVTDPPGDTASKAIAPDDISGPQKQISDTPGNADLAMKLRSSVVKKHASRQLSSADNTKVEKANKMSERSAKGAAPSPALQPGDAVVSVAKSGTRKGKRGTLLELAATDPRKWRVRWDDGVPGKPYSESKLEKIKVSNSVTTQQSPSLRTVAKKAASRAPPVKGKRSLKPGDSVVSIASTGTRKGKRGKLVKLALKEPRKWTVSWDDGVPGKPYPESKLKRISSSD